jgi:polyisoprenoid-binding protein YceI
MSHAHRLHRASPTTGAPATALLALTAFAALGGWDRAVAAPWTLAPESSSVTLWATKQGAWFNGVFETFRATIDLDPAHPETGSIVGIVRTDSFQAEDVQDGNYVRGYLDVGQYPEARFESKAIERTAEGFSASGELTLTGITKPATLAFTFATGADSSLPPGRAHFSGLMTINRFDFEIATDVDIDRAGQDVTIQIELDLEQ